jgi:hypothetical protein
LLLLAGEREHLLRDGAVVALAIGAFATILCSCVLAAYYPQHGVPFMGVLVICVVFALNNSKRILGFLCSPAAKTGCQHPSGGREPKSSG